MTFQSTATNLVDNDTNATTDIFVRDITNGTTTRIVSTSGEQGNSTSSGWAPLSADGRYIVFRSSATNFGGDPGLYLHDLTTGETTPLVPNGFQADVSDDGRFVAFTSSQSFVPADTNASNDTYVFDRNTATYELESVASGGGASNGASDGASISGDGTRVAFASMASNLVASDTNGAQDVFVRDRAAGTTNMASVTAAGTQPGGLSNFPWISGDGRFASFRTGSAFDPADTNGMVDVYVRDLQDSDTILVSVDSDGSLGNNWSENASLSHDGLVIAFSSYASNFAGGDSNLTRDIFVHDRGGPTPDFGSDKPLGWVWQGAFSEDPVNLASGSFFHSAVDLSLPGRLLPLSFVRYYNSADMNIGPLGPGWTHSYNWTIADAGATVDLRRGDGRVDRFTRNPDLSYSPSSGVFDTLVKNPDATYTLTLTTQYAFAFSSAGQLTGIREPAGNQLTLGYTAGNLTTISDAVGRQVMLTYDGANRLTQLQDPIGRKLTYEYDGSGRLATVTDKIGNAPGQNPSDHQWRYAYDGTTRHLTTITDPDGRIRVTNSYDAQGRVFEQRDGRSKLTTFTYTPLQTVTTDPRGHATTYVFDSYYRLLSLSDVVGGTTRALSYTYDGAGNRDSVTDRNGSTTNFTYDTRGNPLTKTEPQVDPAIARYLTTFQYDSRSNLIEVTDARNFVTTHTFDSVKNVRLSTTQQITAVPDTYAVTKWEFADAANPGLPTRIVAPRGNTTQTPDYTYAQSLGYDAAGNLIQIVDADGRKTTFGYDGLGRQTSIVDPEGYAPGGVPAEHTWTTVYDENDRVTQSIDPLGHTALTAYSRSGNVAATTDRNGNVTSYAYDANTRLERVTQRPDPVGQPTLLYTTQIVRDDNGNATQVTQANGVVTDYGYDELDRLSSSTTHPSPSLALTTSYVLDGNGNATRRTTADGVETNYTYDALDRLKSVSSSGLAAPISYDYDELSQRTRMIDETGTSTYAYDGLGRLTQAVQPNGTLGYGYDLDSNRTTLAYPSLGSVTYAFSPGGYLSTVTDWAARQSAYTYTAAGRVRTLGLPNGMTTTYTYDRAQRLTSLVNATASATISSHAYTLDAEGNRTALDEYLQGITPPVVTWDASVQVNDVAAGQQDRPAIAIGGDGATYLIWDDYRSGTNGDIYFSRRDPATGTWSANQKVNDDTGTRTQWNAAIAVDGANNAYAVWQDPRQGNNNNPDTNIFFSKRSAATGTWSANVRVNDDTKGTPSQLTPRIAVRSTGEAVAAWEDHRSNQWNVYAASLAAGASTWGANTRVSDNTSSRKFTPDVAIAPSGTTYAAWEDDRSGNPDVYWAFSIPEPCPNSPSVPCEPLPRTWSANAQLSDDPGSNAQYSPRLSVDGAGNVIAVWLDDRTGATQVRMSRLPAGTSTWEPSRVVSDAAAVPVSLALAIQSDGDAFVAWQDARGPSYDIWGAEYSSATNTWSAPALISDDTGSTAQLRPAVARTATEVVVAWRDDRTAGGDIRARRRATANGNDYFVLAYDGLNRLQSITGPVAETFTFDGASNITTRTGPTQTDSYDGANRITSDGTLTYTWSDADRLSSRSADTFTYDALDRLRTSSVGGTTRTYTYNGDDLLQSRTQGSATALLWDSSTAVNPLLTVGADAIVYGNGSLYAVRPDASTVTFARDGSKNVRAEVSSSGLVTGAWRYRAYGDLAAGLSSAPPAYFGLASQLRDPSGTYYMRTRWYDPAVGRFMSRDRLTGSALNPVSLNSFAYAASDPVGLVDPSGLRPVGAELSEPLCTALIPVPGKCYAQGQYSDDYIASLLITVRPVSGLGLQISFAKLERRKGGGGSNPSSGGGPPSDPEHAREIAYLYEKLSASGSHLKYGVTSNPATRYTKAQFAGGRLNILAEGAREEMLALERQLHEWLPLGPEEGQSYYRFLQKAKGLRMPPYE